jgi:DNA mismatch repair protein MutS
LSHGDCLRDYASFRSEDAEQVLRRVYELDAVVSILRVRKDHGMSWAEFVDAPEPALRMEGLAHPCLPPSDVRRNDIAMGGIGKKHVLLTGPNAGGKSTLMKAMLCAALLSQTITVAPCNRSISLTPFDMLGSHLNVADSTGFESTFEAEMHRMAGVLSSHADTDKEKEKRLLAIDELFSSTNVVEGTAAAAACARRLGSAEQTLSVISTHFTLVAKEVPSESFACYGMPVKRTKQGKIEFPYRLTSGPSTQYIALELMAMHSGAFDEPLVADALRIKRSLIKKG